MSLKAPLDRAVFQLRSPYTTKMTHRSPLYSPCRLISHRVSLKQSARIFTLQNGPATKIRISICKRLQRDPIIESVPPFPSRPVLTWEPCVTQCICRPQLPTSVKIRAPAGQVEAWVSSKCQVARSCRIWGGHLWVKHVDLHRASRTTPTSSLTTWWQSVEKRYLTSLVSCARSGTRRTRLERTRGTRRRSWLARAMLMRGKSSWMSTQR